MTLLMKILRPMLTDSWQSGVARFLMFEIPVIVYLLSLASLVMDHGCLNHFMPRLVFFILIYFYSLPLVSVCFVFVCRSSLIS